MLHDFDDPQMALPAHADVCVIGAGAAGILLATELARGGLQVVLLEGGGQQQEARSQGIYRSEVVGQPHRGVHEGRFRTYGGSTTQWGGQILELDEEDFQRRQHVAGSGWPFPKTELASFYERALRFEGLRRVEREDERVWEGLGVAPPDLGPELVQAFSRWCPERNFAALHGAELARLPRLDVYTHASVVALELNEAKSRVEAVGVRGFSGRAARLAADRFILCLGGIESTRLLLQPLAAGTAPWQANGLLGRFYQDHIAVNGMALRDVRLAWPWRRFGYVTLRGFRYHNKVKLAARQQSALQTLNVAGTIGPEMADRPALDRAEVLLRQVLRAGRRPTAGEWAATALQLPRMAAARGSQRLFGEARPWRRMALTVHCEQSPEGASRITLGGERDALGMLRTRLDWRISEEELHSLRAYVRVAQAALARAGVGRIEPPEGFFTDDALVRSLCVDSNHHMGGVRMAAAPSEGVVDAELRLHGVANAYVCSSAVFPSSGFSNPTHTLLALAMRLADHVLGRTEAVISATTDGPMREVPLPGSGQLVPQLGFGCAYLLGPGLDRAKSLRLLDAAWDAGIRHFDVARLYGQGHTEALLGEFLRAHPEATVTTKFGVVPPTPAQRLYAAAARRISALPELRRDDKARFDARSAAASLETSLRALGRERVELFLLHEPTVDDLRHDDLLEFLQTQQARGVMGGFGVGGEYERVPKLLRQRPEYAGIVQMEHSIFGPRVEVPPTRRMHYRGFARAAAELAARLARQPGLSRRWSQELGEDVDEPEVLPALLLKASLEDWPETLLLFSSSTEEHIFANVEVAGGERWAAPARRLVQLVREDDLGVGEALYMRPDAD
jgi:choline dehydrogenase-like flavoprotein/aryl-alcohol dehydrogenase-like predicted oxidoreductase